MKNIFPTLIIFLFSLYQTLALAQELSSPPKVIQNSSYDPEDIGACAWKAVPQPITAQALAAYRSNGPMGIGQFLQKNGHLFTPMGIACSPDAKLSPKYIELIIAAYSQKVSALSMMALSKEKLDQLWTEASQDTRDCWIGAAYKNLDDYKLSHKPTPRCKGDKERIDIFLNARKLKDFKTEYQNHILVYYYGKASQEALKLEISPAKASS